MAQTNFLMPIPRWYFAENNGTPLFGSMYTTVESDPSIPKSIYSDVAGVLPWPNPVNFLANGEAPGLFFWANDVPYRITVYDKPNGITDPTAQIVFTVSGFTPSWGGGGSGGGPITVNNSFLENYITNNVFYRNVGTVTNPSSAVTVLAPSNHEGFAQPDIVYIHNGSGASETITFPTTTGDFAPGLNPLGASDVTPETYLDWACTSVGTDTFKAVQFPIDLHVKNLESQLLTGIVWAKAPTGTPNLTMSFIQNFGTGPTVSSSVVKVIPINASPVANVWTAYVGSFTVPTTGTATLGGGSDDASYIQIGLPLGATEIYFTKPKLYLGGIVNVFPELPSYDYVDRIINSPRTGDIRTSMNSVTTLGWVPMNDGTIGNALSSASTRANADTWQLFNMLWPLANTDVPLFTSGGVLSSRSTDAITDFNANKQMALPKGLGRVFAGANPSAIGVTKFVTASSQAVTANLLLTTDDTSPFYIGTQVTFSSTLTLPGGISTATQYWLTPVSASTTTFLVSTSLANALLATPVYIPFSGAGTGTISFTTTLTAHALGSFRGEDTEALTIGEMPAHTHPTTANNDTIPAGVASANHNLQTDAQSGTTGATGGSTAHNILQPTTYMNVYIKL